MAQDVGEPEETGDAMVPAHGNHPWTHPIREFGTASSEFELLEQQVSRVFALERSVSTISLI